MVYVAYDPHDNLLSLAFMAQGLPPSQWRGEAVARP